MKKQLLTFILAATATLSLAQYAPQSDFKEEFRTHMLTPTEKPQLTFEQREVLHYNLAGGLLATVAIPVLVASTLTFIQNGENTNMAATGLAFGGMALGGSIALHSIGIKKAVRYHKGAKNDAFAE